MKPEPPDILMAAAETFRSRNAAYGNNYRNIGPALFQMFPDGVTLRTMEDFQQFHYAVMLVLKLTRWASSGMTHVDSIHDAVVYAAMAEEATRDAAINNAVRESKEAKSK